MKIKQFTFDNSGITIGTDGNCQIKGFIFNEDGIIVGYTGNGADLNYVGWTEDYNIYKFLADGGYSIDEIQMQQIDITLRSMSVIPDYCFCESMNYDKSVKKYYTIKGDMSAITSIGNEAFVCCMFENQILDIPNCSYIGSYALGSCGVNMLFSDLVDASQISEPSTPEEWTSYAQNLMQPITIKALSLQSYENYAFACYCKELWVRDLSTLSSCGLYFVDALSISGVTPIPLEESINLYLLHSEVISGLDDLHFEFNSDVQRPSDFLNVYVPGSLVDAYTSVFASIQSEANIIAYNG